MIFSEVFVSTLIVFACLAFLTALAWFIPLLVSAYIPSRRNPRLQFQLSDILVAIVIYAGIMTYVWYDIGPTTVDLKDRIPVFAVMILVLQGFGFWIILDVLSSAQQTPKLIARVLAILLFQIAFLCGFIVLIPAWVRWKRL